MLAVVACSGRMTLSVEVSQNERDNHHTQWLLHSRDNPNLDQRHASTFLCQQRVALGVSPINPSHSRTAMETTQAGKQQLQGTGIDSRPDAPPKDADPKPRTPMIPPNPCIPSTRCFAPTLASVLSPSVASLLPGQAAAPAVRRARISHRWRLWRSPSHTLGDSLSRITTFGINSASMSIDSRAKTGTAFTKDPARRRFPSTGTTCSAVHPS